MDDETLLSQLEELAEKLGIAVRHENAGMEDSAGAGGLCRLKGGYVLIINPRASARERISVMMGALRRFDTGGIYVKPALRELLEKPEDDSG